MDMTNLTSMKLDATEADKENGVPPEKPIYPYGTGLCLDEVALDKLDLDPAQDMEVGTLVHIMAVAKVTGYSTREYEGGSHRTLDLQITDMSIDDAPEAADSSTLAQKMYGGPSAAK